jgi:myo-inositol-1(or 4)-monophosphatase
MNSSDLDARLDVAVQVIRAAGSLARDFYLRRDELSIEQKGLQDLVSTADREVEALIRAQLTRAFPGDAFLGEEEGGSEAPLLWVIDPIDGTSNFLRGIPYWCVVLAFVVDGVTELGLTYDAVHDELFVARRGRGSKRDGAPIATSGRTSATEACLGLSYSFKTPPEEYEKLVACMLEHRLDHRRMGSSALSLCHVADGRLDGLLCLSCNSWDVLAGLILVEEAGGLATAYRSGHTLLDRRAVAAVTPGLAGVIKEISSIPLGA